MTAAVRCPRCDERVNPGRGPKWPEGIFLPPLLPAGHRPIRPLPTLPHRPAATRALPHRSPDLQRLRRPAHRRSLQAVRYRGRRLPVQALRPLLPADGLSVALDDGTEHINPVLTPLYNAVNAEQNPVSGILLLRNPGVTNLLHQLATGTLPLTHHSFGTTRTR